MEPTRRLGRRLACENAIFRVYLDRVVDGRGRLVENYLVVEPKLRADGRTAGVAILPVLSPEVGPSKIGLLSVFRYPIGAVSLEIPRGFMEKGETEKEAATRELSEETGLSCAPRKLLHIANIAPEAGIIASRCAVFAALACRPAGRKSAEFGHGELKFYSTDEVRDLMGAMKIQDPCTLIACSWLFSRIRSGRSGRSPSRSRAVPARKANRRRPRS